MFKRSQISKLLKSYDNICWCGKFCLFTLVQYTRCVWGQIGGRLQYSENSCNLCTGWQYQNVISATHKREFDDNFLWAKGHLCIYRLIRHNISLNQRLVAISFPKHSILWSNTTTGQLRNFESEIWKIYFHMDEKSFAMGPMQVALCHKLRKCDVEMWIIATFDRPGNKESRKSGPKWGNWRYLRIKDAPDVTCANITRPKEVLH